jgi:hypothetical protein
MYPNSQDKVALAIYINISQKPSFNILRQKSRLENLTLNLTLMYNYHAHFGTNNANIDLVFPYNYDLSRHFEKSSFINTENAIELQAKDS